MSAKTTARPPKTAVTEQPFERKPPLKPRRGLFLGLLVVFAIWVGVLLYLFFTTVWPLRHSISATHPALP
jgi:hypothetical protein